MSKQTYRIIGTTLAIPGVPGKWHAGQEVDVDTDTNEVLAVRLLPTTPEDADMETTPSLTMTVHMSLDDSPVEVKEATETIDERNVE